MSYFEDIRPLTDAERALVNVSYAPRVSADIPASAINAMPLYCISVNEEWLPHIVGALDVLNQPDAWTGTDEQIEDARAQIRALIASITECP